MQTYNLILGAGETRPFSVIADLFVYESGAATPSTSSAAIRIKPDTGAEMILKPGQRFRLAPASRATHWEVSAVDPAVTIAGSIIIGSGEFDDANTLNKVQLDATFANVVKVNNTSAERVPVSLDPTQTFNSAPLMTYTNAANVTAVASGSTVVVSAAANVNGVILEQVIGLLVGFSLLAKATASSGITDGDVLAYPVIAPTGPYTTRQKIPAGKALNVFNTTGTPQVLNVLYTLL